MELGHPPSIGKRLSHVFWIGGSPCSGKSSITAILAERFGLQMYHLDDEYTRHLAQAVPQRHPLLYAAKGASWDDVWMHPVATLTAREIAFYREEWEMVVEDLLAMPVSSPILAEGAGLLPQCVAPLISHPQQAIWVVPTEEFQRREYPRRDWVKSILDKCKEPEKAWENWMGRDAEFASVVAQSARDAGLMVLEVDGSRPISENAELVAAHFGLASNLHL